MKQSFDKIGTCYRGHVEFLFNSDGQKRLLETSIAAYPGYYTQRLQLIDRFFSEQTAQIDLLFLLYGAIHQAHHFAFHFQLDNALCYRPAWSQSNRTVKPFLIGNPNTTHTLLIIDVDMATGNSMTEAATQFQALGYSRSKMFGYLDQGCRWRKFYTPELMHVDELLTK